MEQEGLIEPGTPRDARERYEHLEGAASEGIRAATREMDFSTEEYDERVTDAVADAARDAIFASLLAVQVGTREEFERWCEGFDGEVIEAGSENVEYVVWHAPSWSDRAVAATFQNEREAAVETLRKQAFGQLYAEVVR